MIFPLRTCFGCIHHTDVADPEGVSSRCRLYQEPIDHEVIDAHDCDGFSSRPCEHTLTRWASRHDDEFGVIAWACCVDCGALVTTVARSPEGQIP